MDFESILSSPVNFIQERIQHITEGPDFGISDEFSRIVAENPNILKSIPLVTTIEDVHMTPPGKLVRVRCVMRNDCGRVIVPRLIHTETANYSYMASPYIPRDFEMPDFFAPQDGGNQVELCDCDQFMALLVEGSTEWIREYQKKEKVQPKAKTMHDKAPEDQSKPEASFIQVKIMNDSNTEICYSRLIDCVGFFEDYEEEMQTGVFTTFSSSVPSFLQLAQFPVSSLYEPEGFSISQENFGELRELTLQVLQSVFQPQIAEIVLVWLISITRTRVLNVPIGNFPLNMMNVSQEDVESIVDLLTTLCSSVTYYPCSIENLNSKSIVPEMNGELLTDTPINSYNGNRFIFDETLLTEGQLDETGTENIRLLIDFACLQTSYVRIMENYPYFVSNPVLVLSNTKSLIECTAHIEVGCISKPCIDIPSDVLTMIRLYIDQARYSKIPESIRDGKELLEKKLIELCNKDGKHANEEELHLFSDITLSLLISYGKDVLTQEIIDHAQNLFSLLNQPSSQE